MSQLAYLTIEKAHSLLVKKEISCVELVQYYIDRIKQYDQGKIDAILTLCEEQALAQAKAVDDKIAMGVEIGLLEGIPYTAKDMFSTRGIRTTAASKILENYIPPFSATVIDKLDEAGAILLGKTNQDEFAHGGSTENSAYTKTRNPWNQDYVPGGSSGGSAAAVAADLCIFSLGTDTGGSIREPAAFCGVTGLKPTYGLVSRYGVIAMASSFDCIGPLARTAEDCLVVLQTIAGKDPHDATTLDGEVLKSQDDDKLHNLKLGYSQLTSVPDYIVQAKQLFEEAGYNTDNMVPTTSDKKLVKDFEALAAYYVLVPSEISSNLERYDGIRYGKVSDQAQNITEVYAKTRGEYLGQEAQRRILTGTYALSAGYYDAYYKKAMQLRKNIMNYFEELFAEVDILICPTTLQPAFEFGAKNDPIEMYKTDILTVTANLAGLPAMSVPAGIDSETGLPMGMQIVGKQQHDAEVLAVAKAFQSATDWHKKVEEIQL